MRLLLLILVVAATLPAALPAAAQGGDGTLVFIRDEQVWIATPDGTQERQVTDGTGFWRDPSMDDDGVIVAVLDEDMMVRMTQDGEVLDSFVPDQRSAGITDTAVSPDGSLIAYASLGVCGTVSCDIGAIVSADGTEQVSLGGTLDQPTWLADGSTAWDFSDGDVRTMAPGEEPADWFDAGTSIGGLSASRDGSFLAMAGGSLDLQVTFWALDGPPPAPPTLMECGVTLDGTTFVNAVTYAPSSDAIAFQQGGDAGDGVAVLTGVDPVGCAATDGPFFPGAEQPFWGAAEFGVTEGGGGPVTPPPGGGPGPAGTERIDGGGAADPVAQAVELSQTLFDDGAATRVVLATADRFPDALAGSALAGPFGPILFTAGTGDLDPRVAAEIARATGGDAPVLVLGGTAAVSDQAAATARAAGGDAACATPLPASCRFAGSGREETAALIADVVAAETPSNAGIAMVARGDDFADAITGGAFAAVTGIPILLTPTDLAHPFTVDWMQRNATQLLYVLGGAAAVSDATVAGLPATQATRVAGTYRTATSAAIATQLWSQIQDEPAAVAIVNVRAATGWQTALSAAVASALLDMPQLGVENPPTGLSPSVTAYLGGAPAGTPILGFGDPTLVSDPQLTEAAAALG